jgi:hypothetical protein
MGERLMQRRQFLMGAMALTLGQVMAVPVALGADDHIAQAIAQINRAIPYGEQPHHSSSFVQHIDNAIDHAMMAERTHASRNVKRAIASLRRARRTAYGTHLLSYSRRAAADAQRALSDLQKG